MPVAPSDARWKPEADQAPLTVNTDLVAPETTVTFVLAPLATAVTVEPAKARLVKSIVSLTTKFWIVSLFRFAAVSRKRSLPPEKPTSVSAPAPPVSVWLVAPAWMVSAPVLPVAVMNFIPFSISVLFALSFTVLTSVAALSAMVPPLVICSVLLAPRPLIDAPALAAVAFIVSFGPPAMTLCVGAPRVMVSPPVMLPLISSPAVVFAVKFVVAASCTALMPVIVVPIVALPPPFTTSVLLPVPPLMVTLPMVALVTL